MNINELYNSVTSFEYNGTIVQAIPESKFKEIIEENSTEKVLHKLILLEKLSYPKDIEKTLRALEVPEERVHGFIIALTGKKPYSITHVLLEYQQEFIPEILLLMEHINN